MKRDELEELHFITPIGNVASICQLGVLSHRSATNIRHESVAMPDIQDQRAKIVVPGGRPLHDYANLYICARNPMLRKRQSQHTTLCVLRVRSDVLDIPGAVVTDGNAVALRYTAYVAAPEGLRIVDRELTFAEWWTASDIIVYWRRKSAKMAEILVPDRVPPEFLTGA